jgi:hypothetical protein
MNAMKEDFLHYIWKLKHLNTLDLFTTCGQPVTIIKSGEHNTDAGPDFFNARLKIGNTIWAGNIEVHLRGSDWYRHLHPRDTSYDSIILHLVYEHDKDIRRKDGSQVPVLELKKYLIKEAWTNYERLQKSTHWLACQNRILEIDPVFIHQLLDRMLLERLEQKTLGIAASFHKNNSGWEETFYAFLARNFGFKINALPFELLAKSLSLSCIYKHRDSQMQIEALLFGQAGFLKDNFTDPYPAGLKKEYLFLKNKFKLKPLEKHLWKFMRLRPLNFPTLRISQFSSLMYSASGLFSRVLECTSVDDLRSCFSVDASSYWNDHYLFDVPSVFQKKTLGDAALNNLIINTVVPFFFYYGQEKNLPHYKDLAINFLENLPAEKNAIISKWTAIGIKPDSSSGSQALLQLKNEYCFKKKCLNCTIGSNLIRS